MQNTEKVVILLNGLPRVGKDTVADFMDKTLDNSKILSFAIPMKTIISETFDISLSQLDDYKNRPSAYPVKFFGKTTNFREILQRFGTEGMKPIFGNSVWADLTYEIISKSNNKYFIIPDFRFLVEYQQLENTRVITILVKDKRDLPMEGHASDVELYQNNFKFDYTIENTGTLQDLENSVKKLINKIKC